MQMMRDRRTNCSVSTNFASQGFRLNSQDVVEDDMELLKEGLLEAMASKVL